MDMVIRTFRSEDTDVLAAAFAKWPKPRELFVIYDRRVMAGELDLVVAVVNGNLAGFVTVEPRSSYRPFAAAGVPEIVDLNVLPHERGHRVGTALMDEAEQGIAERSAVVGLGVGLYADYGAAQRMYVRRGYLPDGAGVVLHGAPVAPGAILRLDDDPVLMFTKQLW